MVSTDSLINSFVKYFLAIFYVKSQVRILQKICGRKNFNHTTFS